MIGIVYVLLVNNVVYYLADIMISTLSLCVVYTLSCICACMAPKDVPAHIGLSQSP